MYVFLENFANYVDYFFAIQKVQLTCSQIYQSFTFGFWVQFEKLFLFCKRTKAGNLVSLVDKDIYVSN